MLGSSACSSFNRPDTRSGESRCPAFLHLLSTRRRPEQLRILRPRFRSHAIRSARSGAYRFGVGIRVAVQTITGNPSRSDSTGRSDCGNPRPGLRLTCVAHVPARAAIVCICRCLRMFCCGTATRCPKQRSPATSDALLSEPNTTGAAIDMSSADASFIVEYAGVQSASSADLAALDARSLGRAAAEAARTLSRGDVARLLDVDPSRVSHQATAGQLFSYPGSSGRPVFPDWQFTATGATPRGSDNPNVVVVPRLAAVLAALPANSHPVAVRTFMTTPSQDLSVHGEALSPRDWLVGGGSPTDVTALAGALGEQV